MLGSPIGRTGNCQDGVGNPAVIPVRRELRFARPADPVAMAAASLVAVQYVRVPLGRQPDVAGVRIVTPAGFCGIDVLPVRGHNLSRARSRALRPGRGVFCLPSWPVAIGPRRRVRGGEVSEAGAKIAGCGTVRRLWL
jgi:hypothetical protein